ncbi:glycosyltransferase family 2 protein [Paraflavisolibacter sp. H34]|uniref:glycosyltransferase family 2 protein n=1 Tax=Huijunlia imazamoxiresistens TaxID=3127457 RepID=UPI0030193742
MLVSIVIINYNTFALTCQCIQSVLDFTKGVPYEIILVDNASTECDPSLFKEKFPGIILVINPHNSGFAKGNNLGISFAKGDLVLLLNSDTYLTEDAISKSAQAWKDHPGTGVLGCKMVYPDGGLQYSARRFRSLQWELLDLFRFLPYLLPYRQRARLMLGKYFKLDFTTTADWVNGAFFLFPKEVLQRLPEGKLDERFFMYGEDQLWCEQIKNLGYEILFFAGACIVHIHSGSTNVKKQIGLRKVMERNELVIMEARKGKGLYYYCFAAIFSFKQALIYSGKWIKLKAKG